MTNQDYITVKEDYQWYVGDVCVTDYHGHQIIDDEHYLACPFNDLIQQIKSNYNFDLIEYHCLQSSEPEKPSPDGKGQYGFVQVVYKTQDNEVKTTDWFLFKEYNSVEDCLKTLFFDCSWQLNDSFALLKKLFGEPIVENKLI